MIELLVGVLIVHFFNYILLKWGAKNSDTKK